MFKNLEPSMLGLACSQSELIELTLTHKFRGIELDFDGLREQIQQHGLDHAIRFLKSAPIKITLARLPIDWAGDEASFKSELARLETVIGPLRVLGCQTLFTNVASGSDHLPYHQNFELHRERLPVIADALSALEMKFAIGFDVPFGQDNEAIPFIREPQALVTLLKTTSSTNLGLIVDTWLWTITKGSFELLEGMTASQIADVRLSDVPEGFKLEKTTPKDRLIYGATGVVRGGSLLEWLRQIEYRGPLTPYAHASQFSGLGRDETVRQAAASIDFFLGGSIREEVPANAESVTTGTN